MKHSNTTSLPDDSNQSSSSLIIKIGLLIVALGFAIYPLASNTSYRSSSDFHAAMEIFGSLLGIVVGSVFLVHFYSLGKRIYLFVGMAFLLNGGEDFAHGLFAYGAFESLFGLDSSHAKNFIPATYVTGRLIFAFLILAAPFLPDRLAQSKNSPRETWMSVLIALPVTMLMTGLVFGLNVPRFMRPEFIISRPVDMFSAIVLACCIVAYILETRKRTDPMVSWILISVCINAVGQLQMSFSKELFDSFFDIGHSLKILGYFVPLMCLGIQQIKTIKEMAELRVVQAKYSAELRTQLLAIDEHNIVVATDPAGRITAANKAFQEISGYTEDELLGQDHRILNSGFHPKSFFIDLWKTIAVGNTWKGMICNRAKDGSFYWVQSTIVPMTNISGDITGYLAVRTDVSKMRKMQDDLEIKNEELERFVYVASHDLKSPLVTIQGYIGFLKMDLASGREDRLEGFANQVENGAVSMQNVIQDLLEISRIGRSQGEPTIVNIRELIGEILKDIDIQVSEAEAKITVASDIPDVYCESIQIKQVFQNLITNALKYGQSKDRSLQINISGKTIDDVVCLSVADNGPGVEKEYHEKIFDLFHRLDSEEEGTGIGLAIVKRVAQVHGGRVWVEPTDGGGATFVIALPYINNAVQQLDLAEAG